MTNIPPDNFQGKTFPFPRLDLDAIELRRRETEELLKKEFGKISPQTDVPGDPSPQPPPVDSSEYLLKAESTRKESPKEKPKVHPNPEKQKNEISSSEGGWIKLWRKIQNHPFYRERRIFSRLEAWIDLLILANHKDSRFLFQHEIIEVKRGEVITSELTLMGRWRWSKSKVRRFLTRLAGDQMVIKKADRKKTRLLIMNYETYQESETTKRTTERPATILQAIHNQEEKNVKNEKKKKKIFVEDSTEFLLANLLFSKIRERKPDFKTPNLQDWAKQIDLMVRIDHRSSGRIKEVILWSQADVAFWQNIILSTKGLRKNFDQVELKMKKSPSTSEPQRKFL